MAEAKRTDRRLTRAELQHLEWALTEMHRQGYYGTYGHFEARHKRLMEWLEKQKQTAPRKLKE